MIHGATVKLAIKKPTGTNDFGEIEYCTKWVEVDDVLVGQPSAEDLTNSIELNGKHIAYTLAIPKGDRHDWTDTDVILPCPFFGKYRTVGFPTYGIEENIPLRWNGKVHIERYE